MGIIHLTNANFTKEAEQNIGLTVIDFWATWWGPCMMISPIIEEIADERDDVKICKVNVDEEMELAQKFRVMSIPTLVFLKDGKFIYQMVGLREKNDIMEAIDARL